MRSNLDMPHSAGNEQLSLRVEVRAYSGGLCFLHWDHFQAQYWANLGPQGCLCWVFGTSDDRKAFWRTVLGDICLNSLRPLPLFSSAGPPYCWVELVPLTSFAGRATKKLAKTRIYLFSCLPDRLQATYSNMLAQIAGIRPRVRQDK